MFLKDLVKLFTDSDRYVLDAVRDAMAALVKAQPLDELTNHVDFTRNMVVSLVSDAKHRKGNAGLTAGAGGALLLPAFNIPKGARFGSLSNASTLSLSLVCPEYIPALFPLKKGCESSC